MLIFEYVFVLKEGYKPVMQEEKEREIRIAIKAKNRVSADRAIKALLSGATNVEKYDGICVTRPLEQNLE